MDFIGVQPGWIALDLFGGGGYYSEVLAHHVGPTGLVYLHNDQATKVTPGQLQKRLGNISRRTGRSETLPNIMLLDGAINDLSIPSHSVDLVLLVQIYQLQFLKFLTTNTSPFFWFLNPKKLYIWLLLLVIALAFGTYRVLKNNGGSLEQRQKRKDVPNAPGNAVGSDVEILFFTVNWCPHCKKAKPVWNNVKEEYDQKVINNTKLIFKDINCEKEEEMANKYNIEGYPTIKLQKNNQIIEFDAKPEENALVQFIESTL